MSESDTNTESSPEIPAAAPPVKRKRGRPSKAEVAARKTKEPEPAPAAPVIEPEEQDDPMAKTPRHSISDEEIEQEVEMRTKEVAALDPDILAAIDPSNPIPMSKITLPDCELGKSWEERQAMKAGK